MLEAGWEFGVNPAMIATVIAVEQNNNVNILDAADGILGCLGFDTSLGLGQVKLSTAKMLEDKGLIDRSNSRCDRIDRLQDNKTNVRYVAAYLDYLRDIWMKYDTDFDQHPDIWWTVYNTGKTKAHSNPKPNQLGKAAKIYYSYYDILFSQYGW